MDLEATRKQRCGRPGGTVLVPRAPSRMRRCRRSLPEISVREDRRVILTVGKQWCYVAVDDTPNVIAGVVADSSGPSIFLLE